MKFYDCNTAPSPRRVRMFISEKGLQIPTVEVDLVNRAQLDDEFKIKNPRCTVPLLELDDGEFISDTLAICDYLESQYPAPPLMGNTPAHRARVLMWYQRIVDEGFMAVSESFRNFARGFKSRALTGPVAYEQIPELVERGRKRTTVFFEDLDRHLDGRDYIVDKTFGLADIAALVTVDFARAIKVGIADHQVHLKRWHHSVSARPSAGL